MKLREYQKEGVKFLLSRKRACLFDEMGLGKSIQVAAACEKLKAKRVLVISPASLKLNIVKEFSIWAPSVEVEAYSYNFIQDLDNALKLSKRKYDVVVFDECHALKNWASKQTRNAIKIIAPKCSRIYCLSGTPATRSAADFHPLLSLMQPGEWGKFKDFVEAHCTIREVGFGRYVREIYEGWRNTSEIKEAISKFALRRYKKDHLAELPEKIFSEVLVDVVGEFALPKVKLEEEIPPSIGPILRALGLEKAKRAAEFIRELEPPVVIWAWHREVIRYLFGVVLVDRRVGVLSGAESARKKQSNVEAFQAGDLEYLVVQPLAAGTGFTLTKSKTCVVVEFPWSAAMYDQMIDRQHRIGQRAELQIFNLVAPGSIDERVLKALKSKSKGMKECIGD